MSKKNKNWMSLQTWTWMGLIYMMVMLMIPWWRIDESGSNITSTKQKLDRMDSFFPFKVIDLKKSRVLFKLVWKTLEKFRENKKEERILKESDGCTHLGCNHLYILFYNTFRNYKKPLWSVTITYKPLKLIDIRISFP